MGRFTKRVINHIEMVATAVAEGDATQMACDDLFARLDRDGNGTLDRAELRRTREVLLSSTPATGRSGGGDMAMDCDWPDMVGGLLDELGVSCDGRVDKREWDDFMNSLLELLGQRRFLTAVHRWTMKLPDPSACSSTTPGLSGTAPDFAPSASASPSPTPSLPPISAPTSARGKSIAPMVAVQPTALRAAAAREKVKWRTRESMAHSPNFAAPDADPVELTLTMDIHAVRPPAPRPHFVGRRTQHAGRVVLPRRCSTIQMGEEIGAPVAATSEGRALPGKPKLGDTASTLSLGSTSTGHAQDAPGAAGQDLSWSKECTIEPDSQVSLEGSLVSQRLTPLPRDGSTGADACHKHTNGDSLPGVEGTPCHDPVPAAPAEAVKAHKPKFTGIVPASAQREPPERPASARHDPLEPLASKRPGPPETSLAPAHNLKITGIVPASAQREPPERPASARHDPLEPLASKRPGPPETSLAPAPARQHVPPEPPQAPRRQEAPERPASATHKPPEPRPASARSGPPEPPPAPARHDPPQPPPEPPPQQGRVSPASSDSDDEPRPMPASLPERTRRDAGHDGRQSDPIDDWLKKKRESRTAAGGTARMTTARTISRLLLGGDAAEDLPAQATAQADGEEPTSPGLQRKVNSLAQTLPASFPTFSVPPVPPPAAPKGQPGRQRRVALRRSPSASDNSDEDDMAKTWPDASTVIKKDRPRVVIKRSPRTSPKTSPRNSLSPGRSASPTSPGLQSRLPSARRSRVRTTPPTTPEELWDIIIAKTGTVRLHISDLIDIFERCRSSGLDGSLTVVLNSQEEAEGVSNGELIHLWLAIANNQGNDLTEEMVFDEINNARAMLVNEDPNFQRNTEKSDGSLNLRTFKKLLRALAMMYRVDQCYIITQFAWVTVNHFEMPNDLYTSLYDKCLSKQVTAGIEDEPFTLSDLSRLAFVSNIMDFKEKEGVSSGTLGLVFSSTVRRLNELILERRRILPSAVRAVPNPEKIRKGPPIFGRLQFSLLIEALFWALPKTMGFGSPLQMCVLFLKRASAPKNERAAPGARK